MFLPEETNWSISQFYAEEQKLFVSVYSQITEGICPDCHQISTSVHSRYTRKIKDLPCTDLAVIYLLEVRRFFCANLDCKRQTFAERFGTMVKPYAQRTQRLTQKLQELALAVGGEVGSRLSKILNISASPATLLNLLRQLVLPEYPTPRVLGVDDWCFRKGQRYGTILFDLERGYTVDLLPDREIKSLADWLKAHPGVEIISRDRSSSYAEGARQGAPTALQVAVRFHLSMNLRESVGQVLQQNYTAIRQLFEPKPLAVIEPQILIIRRSKR